MPEPYEIQFQFRNRRWKDAEKGLRALSVGLNKGMDGAAPVLKRELQTFLEGVSKALVSRHGQPWPGGTTKNTLSRRSGRGVKSIAESVRVHGNKIANMSGEIGGEFYLRIHETGGVIKAKKAKYLTIPLPAALNRDGTPKKTSAREWRNTFVAQSKKGNLLIFQRRGAEIVPLYVLKKSVKIPKRLGMKDTIDAGLPLFVDRAMDRMLRDVLKG